MATRRRAREIAFQMLYESDFGTNRSLERQASFIKSRMRNHQQLAKFSISLLRGTLEHQAEIDRLLAEHSTNWSIHRMATIDRNILRLGCYEIAFGDTPGRVAINEAIEIAKRYGDRNSRTFVNGILDRILARQKAN